eukprot:TRINITY_DN5458_c0_g1_i1.p1 TRINITY_DN5458_c0_g1~~TRINITY_DN5458_c0_g1_i1.p1  ORF type:complete len:206 (-),score=35.20 TRINITY_DN5458_c0_g1_i1:171-788(-)
MEEPLLDGLPSVVDLDGPNAVDTFSELRQWVRRVSVHRQLQAAGRLVSLEQRRAIFCFLCRLADDKIRRNLARQILTTLATVEEWTRDNAIDDLVVAVALGQMQPEDVGISADVGSQVHSPSATTESPMALSPQCEGSSSNVFCDVELSQPSALPEEAPAVMTFVHGESGHTACCYDCAMEVQRRRRRCPVCRQQFTSVIRNYTL